MADPEDLDWTPEKEKEDDPGALQREYLKMGKEFLSRMKEDKAKEEAKEAQAKVELSKYAQLPRPPGPFEGAMIGTYKPPLLSKVLDRYETTWKTICARFEDPGVRMAIFQILLHQPFRLTEDEQSHE
jgi:hypothetical protein